MMDRSIYNEFNDRLVKEMVTGVSHIKDTTSGNYVDLSELRFTFSPSTLTPFTKNIYNSIPIEDRSPFLHDITKEQDKINKDYVHELNDPFNLELTKSKLGFYMEDYLCDKLPCPICHGKLYKFVRQNMPMVDLICENAKLHLLNNQCFLWQVKTTVESDEYFDKTKKIINIPNNIYGNLVLNPDVSYRHLQIGFICMHLNDTGDGYRYIINNDKSFILKPNDGSFRCYLQAMSSINKISITWNPDCVVEMQLPQIDYRVNTNDIYINTGQNKNPLDTSVGNLSKIFEFAT
jgi:hypothetical protein